MSDTDEIEWLVENQHHKDFLDRKNKLHWEERDMLKNKIRSRNYIKTKQLSQKNYQTQNISKIDEIYEKYLFDDSTLLNILQNCTIIQSNNVPFSLLSIIILYTGNGIIPISYTLSFLPFFHIRLNEETLKIWWNEIQNTEDHRGIFIPKNIKTAAKEFDLYITERINRNLRYKYTNLMIPTIEVLPINITNDFYENIIQTDCNITKKDYGIALTLPTKGHKEIGGIEMFQRLYLETCFGRNNIDFDRFYVNLSHVQPSHGDDWCFGEGSEVLMSDGIYKLISELKVGDQVRTFPNGIANIKCIIVSNIYDDINMVYLNGNGYITAEHPMLVSDNDDILEWNNEKYNNLNRLDSDLICKYDLQWVLPTDIRKKEKRYVSKVYNFLLDSYHTLNVNGFWCLTLGDGYKGNIIGHVFWSNHKAMEAFLKRQPMFPYVVFDRTPYYCQ